ncbi:dethiobiotin synthase [Legionella jamestowniensis]|uniref:ATP-dependent dethiobiotin synthetase BioD n=1 Tax=Legionella jamestowniensis TaxID=455 RepID=A0A0W0UK33_9GAMM|nr:dethiobiotin synthase [Legionella jamestowniensis]KTD08272.1 dethiobiotin synthetase [Legionella jamestowniensis]OCH98592.1 dethiobiotin synthase [Legionella jamestowniensis]SFL97546.1 dethiobiotin synthetase [Legionella jamestowniensis DSM 19215]
MRAFFITGTDTNCGKTYVTCQILDYLTQLEKKGMAIKPLASGCIEKNGELINEDVLHLQKHNKQVNYPVNNWKFRLPISPHLAARAESIELTAHEIAAFCQQEYYKTLDYLFIEGAGGLMVPLNDEETWLDFLKLTRIPVILVVGMKLGCINHALLTTSVLQQHNIPFSGWIANCLDKDMLALSENIATLSEKISAPLLATLPFQGKLIPHFLTYCFESSLGIPSMA